MVAITVGSLQIHGEAVIVPYGSTGYREGRDIYDSRFPQYKEVFEKVDNELYIVKPYVIWNYNPEKGGEMYRDRLVFCESYLKEIEEYAPHPYRNR